MKFILGKKREMVQYYSQDGIIHPATIVDAGPITVTQIKTKTSDGYDAIQVGYGIKKESRTKKPQIRIAIFSFIKYKENYTANGRA